MVTAGGLSAMRQCCRYRMGARWRLGTYRAAVIKCSRLAKTQMAAAPSAPPMMAERARLYPAVQSAT